MVKQFKVPSQAIQIIEKVLCVEHSELTEITVLKKGMTNHSFLFTCRDQKYIMRIPGEGTSQLIDRTKEAAVYQCIRDQGICDDIVYIDPANGYKITKYIEGARTCDPRNREDIRKCMECLKNFHRLRLSVGHTFDIFGMIDFYESLRRSTPSIYRDYEQVKKNVMLLKSFVDRQPKAWTLTHIDAVPDNFLFVTDKDGWEEVRLIDWEYAGMQDPHVDLAMFCVYSMYDRCQVDDLIDIYFSGECEKETRAKIYCYISACGLLWSNWSEYKREQGVDFGEYALRQYCFAKEYYGLAAYAIRYLEKREER